MKTDFIPNRDADLDAHEENFINKLSIHAPVIGLDPVEVTDSIGVIAAHRNSFTSMNSKRAESKSASQYNRNKKTNAINEIRRIAKKIKSSKNYTQAIGADLQIVGTALPPLNNSELKPLLKARVNGQEVILQFRKDGTDGIKIYSKRGGEADFSYIGLDTSSPYNDSRQKLEISKPEQREYFAYYFENDMEIGHRSDIVKVVIP